MQILGIYRIVCIFDESVDRHQRQIRLTLGIVNKVQINKLLQLQIVYKNKNIKM